MRVNIRKASRYFACYVVVVVRIVDVLLRSVSCKVCIHETALHRNSDEGRFKTNDYRREADRVSHSCGER